MKKTLLKGDSPLTTKQEEQGSPTRSTHSKLGEEQEGSPRARYTQGPVLALPKPQAATEARLSPLLC